MVDLLIYMTQQYESNILSPKINEDTEKLQNQKWHNTVVICRTIQLTVPYLEGRLTRKYCNISSPTLIHMHNNSNSIPYLAMHSLPLWPFNASYAVIPSIQFVLPGQVSPMFVNLF